MGVKVTWRMKAMLIISTACLAIIGVGVTVTLLVELRSNRDLRAASVKMEAELRAAQKTLHTLRADNQEIAKQLAVSQEASGLLQTRILEIEAAGGNNSETATAPPIVAPYQVQAYLGQTYLGQAWIIPRNFRMDAKAKRYVYEPVVWLDENLRDGIAVHHTNVVEREVETAYVNNSYYPQPVYYIASPGHHRGPKPFPTAPRPPSEPQGPSAPQSPPGGMQPALGFDPGSGVTTPQRLGTPAGAIKTRPQVLGTPAKPPR
jgi:hypothetical protein